jgi:non-ribosomal peptide synthetase component E (peptide arylation enzyme)
MVHNSVHYYRTTFAGPIFLKPTIERHMQTLTVSARHVPEQISELRDDYPHSIALSHGDRCLSYEELDAKADRVAAYLTQLAARGVRPGA